MAAQDRNGENQQKVLDALKKNPGKEFDRKGLEELTGLNQSQVGTACQGLRDRSAVKFRQEKPGNPRSRIFYQHKG